MKPTTPLLLAACALTLPACSALEFLDPTAALTGGGGGGSAMVDAMVDQPAMNVLTLPPEPEVGQSWTLSMSGMEQTTAIVAEREGQLVVEQAMDMGGEVVVQAFLVDPSVDLAQEVGPGDLSTVNVTAAWVGAEGGEPKERPVMDAFEIPAATGGSAPQVDFEQGTESIELAGRSWNAQWTESMGSRTWMAAGTSFLLRSVTDGSTTMELVAFETGAEPSLDWTAGE